MTPPLLELRNVTVCRGRTTALREVSLSIAAGEHVAILGPNGSGKSTLIKAIARECYPMALPGMVFSIFGEANWDVFRLRRRLGIVTFDLAEACHQELTGREVVLSGFFSGIGLWQNHHVTPVMEQRAAAVLAVLEANHLAERLMTEMSSGEARRLLIARALVHQPAALLLDEPTTSLDLRATHELREVLRQLARQGTGLILVTHHLHEIVPEIERVILLRAGEVIGDGSKSAMLNPERLEALFGLPVQVRQENGYYQVQTQG